MSDISEEIRNAVIDIIRDNLTVDVTIGYGYYSCDRNVTVKIKLDGETISESSDSLPTPSDS